LGDCLLWAVYWAVTYLAQILRLLFPGKRKCIYFDKKGLCYILGDFLANSSGHPAPDFSFVRLSQEKKRGRKKNPVGRISWLELKFSAHPTFC
jgi:hypothetical protein